MAGEVDAAATDPGDRLVRARFVPHLDRNVPYPQIFHAHLAAIGQDMRASTEACERHVGTRATGVGRRRQGYGGSADVDGVGHRAIGTVRTPPEMPAVVWPST